MKRNLEVVGDNDQLPFVRSDFFGHEKYKGDMGDLMDFPGDTRADETVKWQRETQAAFRQTSRRVISRPRPQRPNVYPLDSRRISPPSPASSGSVKLMPYFSYS